MNEASRNLRRVLGIGLAWAILWTTLWAIVVVIIGIVDPDSIDPGEGPMVAVAILGPMGLLSGVAFGALSSIVAHGRTSADLSLMRAAALGILGSAIVQLAYLGHGDQGLAANIKMALLFSVIGGGITVVWLVISRSWSRRRSDYLSRDPHDFGIG
jgi:hypothetical protein